MGVINYFKTLFGAIATLLTGLKTTITVFFRKKSTQCYPENRATLKIAERFRGTLTMPVVDGKTKCIGCGICQNACPNGTITVITRSVVNPETGKAKKELDRYIYDHGSCTYCQLCVNACPYDAIEFTPEFECAVFDRSKLVMQLNPVVETEEVKPNVEPENK
ncbi:MAG: 4Fe-4S dicluster domain-containing protein [Flavobacteriales bacterium]|nr:4Fe-4S dicluster domain-containing protein [Flavobacteriales bacterium]